MFEYQRCGTRVSGGVKRERFKVSFDGVRLGSVYACQSVGQHAGSGWYTARPTDRAIIIAVFDTKCSAAMALLDLATQPRGVIVGGKTGIEVA
jgi:hypothetical protein